MSTEGPDLEFTFAHLSDVHLGPISHGDIWRNFALKRLIGGLSWGLKRRKIHDAAVAMAVAQDIRKIKPDHVAFTGDLLNIAAHEEFRRGAQWLACLGDGPDVSFTPGNHDAYVRVAHEKGLSHFSAYMSGDMRRPEDKKTAGFPFIRLRRNVAFIGLNTAVPQTLYRAGGRLGPDQLALLKSDLLELKARGFYRVVMLHHPPLPGLATARKSLSDAFYMQEVLKAEGAELVLHGHNHRRMLNSLPSDHGPLAIHGVPSASASGMGKWPPAEWHHYSVDRSKGRWRTQVTVRTYDAATMVFNTGLEFELHAPPVSV
jgi:3',5'-cyclic AMP phosphodiesterase CpdA